MNYEEVNKYEVWTQRTPLGKVRKVVILRKFGEYATVAYSSPSGHGTENTMTITVCGEKMLTDVGKLGYAYYESLDEYCDRLPKDEAETIEKKFETAFGVSPVEDPKINWEGCAQDWKAKYDFMKEMYDELLQKVMRMVK